MSRLILHIDMDAFYASVEQRDNPELRGKPVIVGGTSGRGVVSAASYEARKYGVRSAMPIFQAKKRCPNGIFVPVRMDRYIQMSERVMAVLDQYSPLIEQVSVDEAYMDISGLERLHGSAEEIARKIKAEIKKETFLTCSIGIAPTKLFAKIASEMSKPDGLSMIRPDRVDEVIRNLPVDKVPGVGEKAREKLGRLGVATLGDLRKYSEQRLVDEMGRFGLRLREFSLGIDASPVVVYSEAKSVSNEETFEKDTDDPEVIKREILVQAESVGRRLRGKGVKGCTITLKLKRSDFTQHTRSITLKNPTNSTETIYKSSLRLLDEVDMHEKFRLVGVGVSNFSSCSGGPVQMGLFEEADQKKKSWENVEKAMDLIKSRFGRDAIKRGPGFIHK
jgi:DNA polymerase-4